MKIFWKIMRESTKIVIATSVISSLGGIGLEGVNQKLVTLIPFLILVPAMNDMIGDFGTIMSSRITTMLYLGKIKERGWWKAHDAGDLFVTVAVVAVLCGIYISLLSGALSLMRGFSLTPLFMFKLVLVTLMTTMLLVVFMFWLSATAGFYVFKKKKDPSNFLIPITTSIADLGSMVIISMVIMWFF